MDLLIILIIGIVLFIVLKPYFLKYDTLVSFTGGLGSGKTFKSVETALVLYRKQRLKAIIYNILHPKHKKEIPQLYSNIPLRIGFKKYALRLKKEHLMLQERIAEGSVCLLDEVDVFANQFQYNNPAIVNTKGGEENGNFDEFCRFYRHYTKGGFLIFNTQATANENLTIRRRQNTVITLFHFRVWGIPIIAPSIFYTVKVRNVTLSDDIKTVEENNAEDNMRLVIGFMPLFRHYDTYCYSGRYSTVPKGNNETFGKLKTNVCLISPYGKQDKFTTNKDIDDNKNTPLENEEEKKS